LSAIFQHLAAGLLGSLSCRHCSPCSVEGS